MAESTISISFDRDVNMTYRIPGDYDTQNEVQALRKSGQEIGVIFQEIEDLSTNNGVSVSKTREDRSFHGYDGAFGWITTEFLNLTFSITSISALAITFKEVIHKYLNMNQQVCIKKGDITITIRGVVEFDKLVELLKDVNETGELEALDLKSEFEIFKALSSQSFNSDDLQSLAFQLNIDWENLSGDTRDGKARSLVKYSAKIGKQSELVQAIIEMRPDLREKLSSVI